MSSQIEMVNLDQLIPQGHPYRTYHELLDFSLIKKSLTGVDSWLGSKGFGAKRLFLALLLQFMEDLSDREAELILAGKSCREMVLRFFVTG